MTKREVKMIQDKLDLAKKEFEQAKGNLRDIYEGRAVIKTLEWVLSLGSIK